MALVFDIETIAGLTPSNVAAVTSLATGREMTADHYGALCPPLSRVVCIGWYDTCSDRLGVLFDAQLLAGSAPSTIAVADGVATTVSEVEACFGEAGVLESFGRRIDSHAGSSDPQLVTFNGRGFDLPVLVHRSVVSGVEPGRALLLKALSENRYRPLLHVDLMDVLTFYGATQRWPLAAYALGYGLASPKGDMDGSQVAPAVAAGRILDVARYCAGDVIATAGIYRRVQVVEGWLPKRPTIDTSGRGG